ncbi:MAG: universal stress protein [Bacteroidales bacterium]
MNKILIPIDFQKQSLLALEQSYNLARLLQAEIVLLYVHEQSGIFAGLFSNEQNNEMLSKIDEKLAEVAGKASMTTGFSISYMIEKGRIYSKIIDVAKQISAKYIVMGTHSATEADEIENRVGANTSRVIRSASCPVITINSKHLYHGCRHILLPLDLTKETRQKVTMGIEIARIYGAGIKVVSALWSKNDPAIIGRLYQQGDQVTNFISEAGIECTFEIIESSGGEKTLVPSILNYAKQQGDIDLVIILTQQEIGIVEYFVGSHAQEFIRLSEIPVMSLVPKELGFTSIFS